MHFPFWQYLNQPLWDSSCPPVFNPFKYWRRYRTGYLKCCLKNAFLEKCWRVNYRDFVSHHQDMCSRNAMEEDAVWLLEHCWRLNKGRCNCSNVEPPWPKKES